MVSLQSVSENLTVIITTEVPVDKVMSVDTEYDPNGRLLTIAIADRTHARVWDISDGIEGA